MGDFFNNRCFWFTKFLLFLSGQWPFDINIFAILWKISVLWSIFLKKELIAQMKMIYFSKRSISQTVVMLSYIINIHVELVPFVYGYIYLNEIKHLLKEVKDYWHSVDEKCCIKVLKKCAEYGRMIMIVHIMNVSLRTLIIDANRLKDVLLDDTDMPFVVNLARTFLQAIHATRQCLGKIAFDLLYSYVVVHTCCRLDVLGHQILKTTNFDTHFEKDFNLIRNKKEVFSILKKGLKGHIRAVNYFKLVELTFRMWIIVTLINCLQLLTCFIIAAFHTKNFSNVRINMSCIREAVECFINMLVGQKLIDTSYQVHEKICKVKWYDFSKQIRYMYLMVLTKTTHPIKFTIFKVLTISIQIIQMILKLAVSFYTFYKDMEFQGNKGYIR